MVFIGDVCEVIAGQSPEGKNYNNEGDGLPFYQGKKDFGEIYINPPSVWTTQTTKEALEGDILMSVRAPVGPVNISTEKICIGRGLAAIRAGEKLNKFYLFYYLLSIEEKLIGNSGAVFNSINKNQIQNIKIPLPSLATQIEIVEKLDAIFAEIDKAIAATEANIKNADALYMTSVNKVFNDVGAAKIPLGSLSKISYGYTAKATQSEEGVYYLRITDIQNDSVDWGNVPKIQPAEDLKKFTLKDGDIVFARTGATTGKSYLVKNPPNAVFASYLIRVDLDREQVEPSFMKHYFMSRDYWRAINLGISGAAQGGFNAAKLGELLVPFLDKKHQLEVVVTLDKLWESSQKISLQYKDKLDLFHTLKKSILDLAFKGTLVKERE